jgi:hypothetical protein
MGEREDGLRLPLGVGMKSVGLDVAFVLEQTVEDVDRLPDAARNEVAEEGDVGVGDLVVADASVSAIADVVLREKVLFIEIPPSARPKRVCPIPRASARKSCYRR